MTGDISLAGGLPDRSRPGLQISLAISFSRRKALRNAYGVIRPRLDGMRDFGHVETPVGQAGKPRLARI